ncbi:hypothetical protein ColTof4_07096 [Colletotrichum tofieldiae]|nr:hypothetical protein ColTof4_07096 [Colletotrichum tofieldiae]
MSGPKTTALETRIETRQIAEGNDAGISQVESSCKPGKASPRPEPAALFSCRVFVAWAFVAWHALLRLNRLEEKRHRSGSENER